MKGAETSGEFVPVGREVEPGERRRSGPLKGVAFTAG